MQRNISMTGIAFVLLSFFVTACSTANNAPLTSTASPVPVSTTETTTPLSILTSETKTGIISPREALELMYGKDRTFSTDWAGNPYVMLTTNTGYGYWVKINTLACFLEFKSEKCLVITNWNEGSCHICGVERRN